MRSAKSHNSSSDCKGGFEGWPGAGVIYELLRLRDLPASIAFYVIVTVCSGQYNSIKHSTLILHFSQTVLSSPVLDFTLRWICWTVKASVEVL